MFINLEMKRFCHNLYTGIHPFSNSGNIRPLWEMCLMAILDFCMIFASMYLICLAFHLPDNQNETFLSGYFIHNQILDRFCRKLNYIKIYIDNVI